MNKIYKCDLNGNPMANNNLDEEDKNLIKGFRKFERYSESILYGSVAGLAIAAVNYYFSGEPSLETLNATIKNLDTYKLMSTAVFSTSAIGYFVSCAMYGISNLLEEEFKKSLVKNGKISNLEERLEY